MKIDPKDIKWNAAQYHAKTIVKICDDVGFTPPEAYGMPLQRVCVEIDGIAKALHLLSNGDKKADKIIDLLRNYGPGRHLATALGDMRVADLDELKKQLAEIVNTKIV